MPVQCQNCGHIDHRFRKPNLDLSFIKQVVCEYFKVKDISNSSDFKKDRAARYLFARLALDYTGLTAEAIGLIQGISKTGVRRSAESADKYYQLQILELRGRLEAQTRIKVSQLEKS